MDQMSLIVKLDPHNSQIVSAVECCWIYGFNHMTFLFLMTGFGQGMNMVITVPEDGLAPNGARPSSGTVLITRLYMTVANFEQDLPY